MNKHTPRPWHVQGDHGKLWIETNGNDDTIAEVHRRAAKGSVYSCKEASANARLIAAAPDLLEALVILRSDAYEACADSSCNGALELADAAIAKARGES
jgi:hypothetical protein